MERYNNFKLKYGKMNIYDFDISSIYLFIKILLIWITNIIGAQGFIICFQLSNYLKEIWNSDVSIGNYFTNTKNRIDESRNLNRDLCNDWMIICLHEEKNLTKTVYYLLQWYRV